jgi:hypothetical protein
MRLRLAGAGLVLLIVVIVAVRQGPDRLVVPLPGIGRAARAGDPFAYLSAREPEFVRRATAGSAHVLFTKSPGGVVATAARVAAFRGAINAATRGTHVDPQILEAIVFVESAGRADAIAGADVTAAAGLTQILASTGQSLLGMHIDIPHSRRLTSAMLGALGQGRVGLAARLERERAGIDERFDPGKALDATVRYLSLAQQRFGRADLAVVSYHMGIGNLQRVLSAYDSGRSVPYAQLYFDTAPDRHASAYNFLTRLGDQSSLYYWRVLGAAQVMQLYRSDRPALVRMAALQTASDSAAEVLHPPDRTPSFADPRSLAEAYSRRTILPLPSGETKLGLAYDPGMGSLGQRLGAPARLYQGLRPAALDLLIELAARVRALSGGAAPLTVDSTVSDDRYGALAGVADRSDATGYAFQIARSYVSRRQAAAFQAMLDRLQALNLIAWTRGESAIHITVAPDASQVIVRGP